MPLRPRHIASSPAAWLLAVCTGLCGQTAAPPDEEIDFDIAAGPLEVALVNIGQRAATFVSFRPEAVDRLTAPSLQGRYTLLEALNRITRGSGLRVVSTQGGTWTVEPVAPVEATPAAPAADPGARAAVADGVAVLPPVLVLGSGTPRQQDGLRAIRGRAATRTDTALADLPQAVSVLTGEALELQGNHASTEALRYVPGITVRMDNGGSLRTEAGLTVRGLPAQYVLDGMRTIRDTQGLDTALLERIEVPKGPTSVSGGIGNPAGHGGAVNLVRKQAEPTHRTVAAQSLSSQDSGTLRLSTDLARSLSPHTAWRLIGYGSLSGRTQGGYTRQGSAGLLSAASLEAGDIRSALTLQADWSRSVPPARSRGGREDGSLDATPVRDGIRPPDDPNDRRLSGYMGLDLELEWRLSPRWSLTWKGRAEAMAQDEQRAAIQVNRLNTIETAVRSLGMQAGLTGTVRTGPVEHVLLLGLDSDRVREASDINRAPAVSVRHVATDTRQSSVLLQDQISFGGLRARLAAQRTHTPNADGLDNAGANINWDVGAMYRWHNGFSAYVGAQDAVQARALRESFLLADGSQAPDDAIQQVQGGLKLKLRDGRMDLTLEVYRLRQANRLAPVPDSSPPRFMTYQGRNVQGLEMELAGSIMPAWQVRLGLELTRGTDQRRVQPSSSAPLGLATFAATDLPARGLSLQTTYDMRTRDDSGLRLGMNLRSYSSSRTLGFFEGDTATTSLQIPGGTQLDLFLRRTTGPWTLDLLLSNALNRQLYGTLSQLDFVPVHPLRALRLTVAYTD